MRTVDEVFQACESGKLSGIKAVGEALPVTDSAIRYMRRRGVPEKYWAQIIEISGGEVTVEDLHKVNQSLRADVAPASNQTALALQ